MGPAPFRPAAPLLLALLLGLSTIGCGDRQTDLNRDRAGSGTHRPLDTVGSFVSDTSPDTSDVMGDADESADSVESSEMAGAPEGAKEIVDGWARQRARTDGMEVYDKKIFAVDFDDDGDTDVVGLCAMGGGGSGYRQYIAAFRNTGAGLLFAASGDAGESGVWAVEKVVSAKSGKIYCLIDRWVTNDANCCPSGRGKSAYRITGRTLELDEWQ